MKFSSVVQKCASTHERVVAEINTALCHLNVIVINHIACMAFILRRYSVKCEPGQLLSYSVHEFNLEPKSTCSNQLQCIDYVEIRFRNLETKPRFCGSGEVGEVHVDGSNEMTFEFASNRRTEKGGFLYFVTCTDPGFDQNAVDSGVVPRSKKPADININACSAPPTQFQRPTFIQVYFVAFIF